MARAKAVKKSKRAAAPAATEPAEVEISDYRKAVARAHAARIADVSARTGVSKRLVESLIGAWNDACRKFKLKSVLNEKTQEAIARREVEHPWAMFLGGHWTMFRPRTPGFYLLADLEGVFRRVEYIDPAAPITFAEPWRGWFWSRPIPGNPRTIPGAKAAKAEQ